MAKKNDPTKLSAAEELAVQEYLRNGGDQSKAVRKAFPQSKRWKNETIWTHASLLFKQPKVQQRVADLRSLSAAQAVVTERELLTATAKIAFADIRQLFDDNGHVLPMSQWPEGVSAAVESIEYEHVYDNDRYGNATGQPRGVVKRVRLASKLGAQEKLFKHLGLYERDNMQKGSFQMTGWEAIPPELRQILVERLREIAGKSGPGSGMAGATDALPGPAAPH